MIIIIIHMKSVALSPLKAGLCLK